jgi:DNA-binding response OmpR family regulator
VNGGGSMRILLVEDEARLADALEHILKNKDI